MTTVERVHLANRNLRWAPAVLERARRFCETYDSDADVEVMTAHLMAEMFAREPSHLILVGIQDEQAVGHLVALIEDFYGSRGVTVTQLMVDREAHVPREVFRLGMDVVEQWARSVGACRIGNWARNPAVARLFQRYGFEASERVLMRKPLATE